MTKKVSKMKLEIIAAVNETTAAMIEINQIAVLRSANPKTTRSLTIHGPGAPAGILLPSLLTPGAVMDAFQHAGTPIHSNYRAESSQ